MNGLVIHSILEFPFCLIKSTGSTFGYLTGERRLPAGLLLFTSFFTYLFLRLISPLTCHILCIILKSGDKW